MVVDHSLISRCSLSFVLVLIQFCAVFHICISEKGNDEGLDEKIAFDVPGQQQPIDVARGFPADSPTGYVVYCPCMGRFGNQADQFLGALSFAKGLNRTLVLPPWIVYLSRRPGGSDRIPFDDWFRVKPLQTYLNVITMENFMKDTAPRVWPVGERIGFCYSFREGKKCAMKEGNPFGPFWDHFHVNFDDYREHAGLLWDTDQDWARNGWNSRFPVSDYPVIALMGAPGAFPVEEKNRWLQKFVRWSLDVENIAKEFVSSVLKKEPFVGIHLRNGIDFEKACNHLNDPRTTSLFASPQCIPAGSTKKLSFDICLPPKKEILKKTKKIVKRTKAKKVFVATDYDPMITELTKALKSLEVTVHKRPASDEAIDPIIDLAILTMADHFIGNCVSSFTSFVTRYRAVDGKPTSFWAFDDKQ